MKRESATCPHVDVLLDIENGDKDAVEEDNEGPPSTNSSIINSISSHSITDMNLTHVVLTQSRSGNTRYQYLLDPEEVSASRQMMTPPQEVQAVPAFHTVTAKVNTSSCNCIYCCMIGDPCNQIYNSTGDSPIDGDDWFGGLIPAMPLLVVNDAQSSSDAQRKHIVQILREVEDLLDQDTTMNLWEDGIQDQDCTL